MPVADVDQHPLLSAKAKALLASDPLAFNAQVEVAEALLGIPTSLPSPVADRVKLGIAMQLNFQIEQGLDPLYVSESTSAHTRNSVRYRDRYIDPRAVQVVNAVLGMDGAFSQNLTSLRFSGLK